MRTQQPWFHLILFFLQVILNIWASILSSCCLLFAVCCAPLLKSICNGSGWLVRPAPSTLNSHKLRCHTCQRSNIYLEWFPFMAENGCSKAPKPQVGFQTFRCQFYCSVNHLKNLIKWLHSWNLDSCWKDSGTDSKLNHSFRSGGFKSLTATSVPHFITLHFPDQKKKKKDIPHFHPYPEVQCQWGTDLFIPSGLHPQLPLIGRNSQLFIGYSHLSQGSQSGNLEWRAKNINITQ